MICRNFVVIVMQGLTGRPCFEAAGPVLMLLGHFGLAVELHDCMGRCVSLLGSYKKQPSKPGVPVTEDKPSKDVVTTVISTLCSAM